MEMVKISMDSEITYPSNITVSTDADGMTIRRAWIGWESLIPSVFAVLWIFFLGGEFDILFLPVIHKVVSAIFVYYALASWLNRTKITVNSSLVKVSHYPVPWWGGGIYPTPDIKCFYLNQKTETTTGLKHSSTAISYELHALLGEEQVVKVVNGIHSEESAQVMVDALNQYLELDEDEALTSCATTSL